MNVIQVKSGTVFFLILLIGVSSI